MAVGGRALLIVVVVFAIPKPLFELAVGPDAFALACAVRIYDEADSMLHAVDPLAAVLASVRVSIRALTMLFVESIVAFVLATILPDVVTVAVHNSILEAALEVAAIRPLEAPSSAHFIVGPVASILGAVCPEVDAFSLLDAIFEVAVVVAAIRPNLDPFAILFVLCRYFGLSLNCVKVILDVKADVLTKDAQVCLSILLPEALINLFSLCLGSTEDT